MFSMPFKLALLLLYLWIAHLPGQTKPSFVNPKTAPFQQSKIPIFLTTDKTIYLKDSARFSVTCRLPNSNPFFNSKHLSVSFSTDRTDAFARYDIVQNSTKLSKFVRAGFSNKVTFDYFAKSNLFTSVMPIVSNSADNHNFTSYALSLTPRRPFYADFWCATCDSDQCLLSRRTTILVTMPPPPLPPLPPPPPTFSSQIVKKRANSGSGAQYALTCHLPAAFNSTGRRYLVNFYNSQDLLMASYKVDEFGKAILSLIRCFGASAQLGEHSKAPRFEVRVWEKSGSGVDRLRYWCELVVLDEPKSSKIKGSQQSDHQISSPVQASTSAQWSQWTGPTLDFTASALPMYDGLLNQTELTSRCTVGNFGPEYASASYKVGFWTTLSAVPMLEMAYFLVQPNKTTVFFAQDLADWASIEYGASTRLPHFDIVANLVSGSQQQITLKTHWFCQLEYIEPGKGTWYMQSNSKSLKKKI